MGHINVSGEGVVGSIKDLHFLPDGKAVLNVSVAVTPSRFANDEWTDLATMWYSVAVWGKRAENLAEALRVGDVVAFAGELTMEEYQTKSGGTGQDYRVSIRANHGAFGVIPKALKTVGAGAPSRESDPWQTNATEEPPF